MCNRYASDIRKAGVERDYYGFDEWSDTRLNVILEVFPKSIGPVIRRGANGDLEWARMRWGLPGPARTGGAPVTNIRNLASPHWRGVLGPAHRCIAPFTAFSEYEDSSPKGAKVLRWFAPPDRGMLAFAGVWRTWRGDYGSKSAPNVGEHALFSILTTAPNDLVRPVHAKAMPVILRTEAERDEWLTAPIEAVDAIQARALPNDALTILSDEEATLYVGGYLK
ncbi:MAG: SOS response-associated peptidase [Alphaproteobacteria bacterium]|nr:SOS response-associated peptidase [Alphaproteobacteria bacterium]